MKTTLLLSTAFTVMLATSSFAGTPVVTPSKGVVETAPAPTIYGTRFYLGLQGGINAYQNFGGTRRFDVGGNDVAVEPKEHIGYVGGIKAGYVFGTGTVRPTIEADMFYNGVDAKTVARVNGSEVGHIGSRLDSGAFMGNFLIRFSLGQFQPYVGGGVGYYIAKGNDVSLTLGGTTRSLGSSSSKDGLAWQLIAGADYYFTPKFSTFIEYKFLNYEDGFFNDRVSQQIIVAGVRAHF